MASVYILLSSQYVCEDFTKIIGFQYAVEIRWRNPDTSCKGSSSEALVPLRHSCSFARSLGTRVRISQCFFRKRTGMFLFHHYTQNPPVNEDDRTSGWKSYV